MQSPEMPQSQYNYSNYSPDKATSLLNDGTLKELFIKLQGMNIKIKDCKLCLSLTSNSTISLTCPKRTSLQLILLMFTSLIQHLTDSTISTHSRTTQYKGKSIFKSTNLIIINDRVRPAQQKSQSPLKKGKWESPEKNQVAVRGIYNFYQEVGEIRNFLDLLHSKHESDNKHEYPPG